MPDWLLPGIGLIVANVLVWAFVVGKTYGGVKTRLKAVENKQANPEILPECNKIFTEIKEGLAELQGKVSTILLIMTEKQETPERKKKEKKKG